MVEKRPKSYDFICFSTLIFETPRLQEKELEKSIKRSLKYYKLAPYNQERVDYIRELKNDLFREISAQSTYYQKSASKYAETEDFDLDKMTADYHQKYPLIDSHELRGLISYAIFQYYVR